MRLSEIACVRASLMASASAMIGEETCFCRRDPRSISTADSSVKIQPSPAVFVDAL